MLDEHNQHRSVEILRDKDDEEGAPEPLRIRYMFRAGGKSISIAQDIKLSKVCNICTALVRRRSTFWNAMQSQLSYKQALEIGRGVRFIDVRIIDIVKDMIFSNLLTNHSWTAYVRYITVSIMIMKHQDLLARLVKLRRKALSARTLGITELDDISLYTTSKMDTYSSSMRLTCSWRATISLLLCTQIYVTDTPAPFLMSFTLVT